MIHYHIIIMNLHILFFFCTLYSLYETGIDAQDTKKERCPGPLPFYQDIGCTPDYSELRGNCPIKYNCPSFDNQKPNKCYLHGNIYDLEQRPKDSNAQPCDICTCIQGERYSEWICAVVDCFFPYFNETCYLPHAANECCPGRPVCGDPKNRPTCLVDGKTYQNGDYFEPPSEPNKRCICGPGYTGKNTEPWCTRKPISNCRSELHNSASILDRCAPVYEKPPKSLDCPSVFRCQNNDDRVIMKNLKDPGPNNLKCIFGNLTMEYGDELNGGRTFSDNCVRCVCETPPTPTCVRLPESDCERIYSTG